MIVICHLIEDYKYLLNDHTKIMKGQLSMKTITKLFTSVAVLTALLFTNPQSVLAECHSVYGGGEVCESHEFNINKVVWNPKTSEWWDNIGSGDFNFQAGNEVKFELRVKNTGDNHIDHLTVRDILPSYISWVSGGTYYLSTRTAEFGIDDLDAGETKTVTLFAKVNNSGDIPSGTTCVVNKGEVFKDDTRDTDTSTFCMKKGEGKVLGITTLPSTGVNFPVALALELTALAAMGTAYIYTAKSR